MERGAQPVEIMVTWGSRKPRISIRGQGRRPCVLLDVSLQNVERGAAARDHEVAGTPQMARAIRRAATYRCRSTRALALWIRRTTSLRAMLGGCSSRTWTWSGSPLHCRRRCGDRTIVR
jgi:hypothetical protein